MGDKSKRAYEPVRFEAPRFGRVYSLESFPLAWIFRSPSRRSDYFETFDFDYREAAVTPFFNVGFPVHAR
jgi:hypothetical protein